MGARDTVFYLVHEQARRLAAQFCLDAPDTWKAVFMEAKKSRDQESKYHALLRDISRQCHFADEMLDEDSWKRLLIDAFAQVKADEGEPLRGTSRLVTSLDGRRVVQLGVQSRHFTKEVASEFIEHLYAFGSERGVRWSEKPRPERIF